MTTCLPALGHTHSRATCHALGGHGSSTVGTLVPGELHPPKQCYSPCVAPAGDTGVLSLVPPYLCFEGNLLALFSSSSRRLRASSSWVRGLGAGLGGMVGS